MPHVGRRCYYAVVPRLFFETDPPLVSPPEFSGPSDVLVYFLSLAFSTRYGSLHPLSQLALLLRRDRKIDLAPLTTFADRDVEVEADQVELDRVWQDAAPNRFPGWNELDDAERTKWNARANLKLQAGGEA